MTRETKTFNVDIHQLPTLLGWIFDFSLKMGFSVKEACHIELAMEEVVVNIIHYSGLQETDQFKISCRMKQGVLTLTVSDHGKPFDPTSSKAAEFESSITNRPVGGFGINLIKQLMDTLAYERKDGQNYLTLKKKRAY